MRRGSLDAARRGTDFSKPPPPLGGTPWDQFSKPPPHPPPQGGRGSPRPCPTRSSTTKIGDQRVRQPAPSTACGGGLGSGNAAPATGTAALSMRHGVGPIQQAPSPPLGDTPWDQFSKPPPHPPPQGGRGSPRPCPTRSSTTKIGDQRVRQPAPSTACGGGLGRGNAALAAGALALSMRHGVGPIQQAPSPSAARRGTNSASPLPTLPRKAGEGDRGRALREVRPQRSAISASAGLLPPPLAGEGWGGGMQRRQLARRLPRCGTAWGQFSKPPPHPPPQGGRGSPRPCPTRSSTTKIGDQRVLRPACSLHRLRGRVGEGECSADGWRRGSLDAARRGTDSASPLPTLPRKAGEGVRGRAL